ncbi:MAG: GNAT family N-acetyltransferase [Polyangia bacterium]
MRVEIVTTTERLEALEGPWNELVKVAGASMLSSHWFLSRWWRAFAGVDELRVLTAHQGDELVAVWPLHLRAARGAAFGARTLSPLGDLRVQEHALVCRPGAETLVAAAMLSRLLEAKDWDVLDVPEEAEAVVEGLARVADQAGFSIQLETRGFRAVVDLPPLATPAWDELVRTKRPTQEVAGSAYAPALIDIFYAIDELHRLLRREWTVRDQANPVLDPALLVFLKEVLPELTARKQGHVGLVALPGVGAIAADVVVADGNRRVQLLRGTDPAYAPAGASEQLGWASLADAAKAGATVFELADPDSPLRTRQVPVSHLQIWNATAVGRLSRGVSALRKKGRALATTPGRGTIGRVIDALAEVRPESAQRLAERLGYKTMHLYRGELFSRGGQVPEGLTLQILDLAGYQALTNEARDALVARLELPAGYTYEKWRRGDLAVVAHMEGRPAGIGWCARMPVFVPDIGRPVRPLVGECYIHEVFVHPDERGRKIAPNMLEHLARWLRTRDVYRSWALIERTNSSSVRAFERANYVAVADVVYVQMGLGSHLFVRPPDPEARALLGL